MAEQAEAPEAPKTKAPTRYAVLKGVATEGGMAWLPVWQTDAGSVDQVVALMQADGHQGEHAFVPLSRFHVRKLGYEQPPPEPTVEVVETADLFPATTADVVGDALAQVEFPATATDDDGEKGTDDVED